MQTVPDQNKISLVFIEVHSFLFQSQNKFPQFYELKSLGKEVEDDLPADAHQR
jgi:hypothetical protein